MNVCLVTSQASGVPPLARKLDAKGYRVLVVFLSRTPRALWTEGSIVCSSLRARGRAEPKVREVFQAIRGNWLAASQKLLHYSPALLSRVERKAARASEEILARAAGFVDSLATNTLDSALGHLPLGLEAYGVIQACDDASVETARMLSTRGGALFFTPDDAGRDAAYDQALLHWLQA